MDGFTIIATAFGLVGLVVVLSLVAVSARRDRTVPVAPQHLVTVEALRPRIVAELVRGRVIGAIKLVRQATGLSLQQAKDAVDTIAAQEGIDPRRRPRRR